MKGSTRHWSTARPRRVPLFPDSRRRATPSCEWRGYCGAMGMSGFRGCEPLGEVLMRSAASMISILVVAVIGLLVYKFYFTQTQSMGTVTPAQTISVVGVKNDLLA